MVKNSVSANAEAVKDTSLIPVSGRSPEGGHGNPLQYSCLEHPHGLRSLAGIVHGVAKSRTRLMGLSMHTCTEMIKEKKVDPLSRSIKLIRF